VISDYTLTNELYCFTVSVPELWSWNQLRDLKNTAETHKEYRGPDSELIFSLSVLDSGTLNGEEYLQVFADVSEVKRSTAHGGSYQPLGTCFLYFKNGELDMPTAKDIFNDLQK